MNTSPLYAFTFNKIILNNEGIPVDYIFLEVNKTFENITNLKAENIINKRVLEVIPNFDKWDFDWIGTYGRVALTGEETEFEVYSSDVKHWYHVHAYSTEKYYFTTELIDITHAKNAEIKQIEKENNFQTFFNSVDDFLFVLDTNGLMIDVNEAVVRRLKYSKDELLGQSVLILHPEERREEAGAIVVAMIAGTKDFCPIPLVTKDGNEIQVETRVYPGIWNGDPALFGVVKDVTKMKQSEEKFSKAFHSGSNLMAISTISTGRYIEVNDLFLEVMEFTKDEVIGKSTLELNLFDDLHQREIIKTIIKENGFVNNAEVKIKTKTGKALIGLFSGTNINIGDEPCLLTTMIDITEKKKDEEKLAKILSETENMNRLMTGREERILELKTDINNLLKLLGKETKYKSVED